MFARPVAGPSPIREIEANADQPHVLFIMLLAIRMAVKAFTRVVLPFLALTVIVLVASPLVDNVFNDQVSNNTTASQAGGTDSPRPRAATGTPAKAGPVEKPKFKTNFNEGTLMAWSRSIHEDTANMRAQLNTPIPTALDPTSYAGLNRALYNYEQAFIWNGQLNRSKIAAGIGTLLFVVVLPWGMYASRTIGRRRAIGMAMLASMAILVAAQPLQNMIMVQASKSYVVNAGFLGDNFESLQYDSQQELINKPAAQAALGVDGQTAAGMAYVAALQNGEPVTNQEIAQFKDSHANPVKATAVAAFSLIQSVVDADLQRPFIWMAVGFGTIINVVLNPLTIFAFLMILLGEKVRRFFRRHLIAFIVTVVGLYSGLIISVLMVTGPAEASLKASHIINSTDTGPLTVVLAGVFALALFWFYQRVVFSLAVRIPRVLAITRGRKRERLNYNTGDVVSGRVVGHKKLMGSRK